MEGAASYEELIHDDQILMLEDDCLRLATVLPPTPSPPSTPPSPIPFEPYPHSVGSSTNSSNDTLDPELFYMEFGMDFTVAYHNE